MSKEKELIREKFRRAVFTRDGNRCRVCSKDHCKLDAHHITSRKLMANGGYVKENGISLCDCCHIKAEVGVLTSEFLYGLIGSSWIDATIASSK
jgi:5-methylcytosine-specific restriction endonuclease McrA